MWPASADEWRFLNEGKCSADTTTDNGMDDSPIGFLDQSTPPVHRAHTAFEQEVKLDLQLINQKLDYLSKLSSKRRRSSVEQGRHRNSTKRGSFDLQRSSSMPPLARLTGAGSGGLQDTASSRRSSASMGVAIAASLSHRSFRRCFDPVTPPEAPDLLPIRASVSVRSLTAVIPSSSFISAEVATKSRASKLTNRSSTQFTEEELQTYASKIEYRQQVFRRSHQIWMALEDPESGQYGRCCAYVLPIFILFTVFVTLLQTVDSSPLQGVAAAIVETTIDFIYLVELCIRFAVCPNRAVFFRNIYHIIDLAAAAPLVLRAAVGFVIPGGEVVTVSQGILLCGVPIIRILKTFRRFEKFHLLMKAFQLAFEALPVLMFLLSVISLTFSVLIYLVEPRYSIPHLTDAVWLTIVTMTTVGYGDTIPETTWGHLFTGGLIVVSVLYMAVPIGIIGNVFTVTWNDRHRLLLMQRTRVRLHQWGYTPHDIPILFQLHDGNGDGLLDIDEFRELLAKMHIGFDDERIYQLFRDFDVNNTGVIDDRDFVRMLYPNSYHEIYGEDEDADAIEEEGPEAKEDDPPQCDSNNGSPPPLAGSVVD